MAKVTGNFYANWRLMAVEVQQLILTHLSTRELAIAGEFDAYNAMVKDIARRRFDRVMGAWGLHPNCTLDIMGGTNALLVGKGAKHVHDGQWGSMPRSLVFYIPAGREEVFLMMLRRRGYQHQQKISVGQEGPWDQEDEEDEEDEEMETGFQCDDDLEDGDHPQQDVGGTDDGRGEGDYSDDEREGSNGVGGEDNDSTTTTSEETPGPVEMEEWETYGGTECIANVWTLNNEGRGQQVHIVESKCTSPYAPLFFNHTTYLMNAVTREGVVCFYPMLSSANIALLNTTRRGPKTLEGLERMREEGQRILRRCTSVAGHMHGSVDGYCQTHERWLNDDWHASVRWGCQVRLTPPTEWSLLDPRFGGEDDDNTSSVSVKEIVERVFGRGGEYCYVTGNPEDDEV